MTTTERTDAAWRLVCSDYGLSKMEMAKATGVSTRTVANMRRTRRLLVERDEALPTSWWQAMQLMKQTDAVEWSEDMKEQVIEARTSKLDEEIVTRSP
jgi:predicted regulator of amino acid metabolism with ACT domain